MMASAEQVLEAPKVLLHDHLDGGLRPRSVIELANEQGYSRLPTTDENDLRELFKRGANRHDLTLYLETFAHTVGVMQTKDALERVAAECAEDLAADGVVYAEVRFAPELHTEEGLTLDEIVDAVAEGFARGSPRIRSASVSCAPPCAPPRAARDRGAGGPPSRQWCVGFDIAGAEKG